MSATPERAQAWSEEPWTRRRFDEAQEVVLSGGSLVATVTGENREADAERIVALSRAFAGIPDPEQALRLAREALATAALVAMTRRLRDQYRAALRALGGEQ